MLFKKILLSRQRMFHEYKLVNHVNEYLVTSEISTNELVGYDKVYQFKINRFIEGYKGVKFQKIGAINLLKKDSVCLFFDRLDQARDNAEVLYEHMEDFPNKYFVISNRSQDYNRLYAKGFKLIAFEDPKFVELYLNADFVFSSSFDYEICDFQKKRHKTKFNFVFLQHGVIYNDLSSLLNLRDIDYIICSTDFEYQLLKDDYLFQDFQIIKSGLPRFDKLQVQAETWTSFKNDFDSNGILAPSWNAMFRYPNSQKIDQKKLFESKFIQQVDCLMNELDLKILLHPNYQSVVKNFCKRYGKDKVILDSDYAKIINEANYVVSDYSSIVFDFAYANKPVFIYDLKQDFIQHIHTPKLKLGYDTPGIVVENAEEIKKYLKLFNSDKHLANEAIHPFLNKQEHCHTLLKYLMGEIWIDWLGIAINSNI
ncbi:MAG: CDP-glycerol glycerophosphotransferase family protein [Mycoplasmatales bacterium]